MLSRLQAVRVLEIRPLSLRGPAKAGTTCVPSPKNGIRKPLMQNSKLEVPWEGKESLLAVRTQGFARVCRGLLSCCAFGAPDVSD